MKAAIYSRKSVFTGKGDSIENQITLCKEYAERYLDKIDEFLLYEDEGFSGSNTNRPEFKRLLGDIKTHKFDVLICYRLDRISRNVADFSTTLEMLQDNNIAFVSIKEQFDTSTPMGKAMVYIASVFAQLERETIAERVRDNMLELAKSGRWLGGQCPLGFSSEQTTYLDEDYNERTLFKLTPVEDEMNLVKLIFDKYYETNSIHMVLKYLLSHNIKGKNGGEFATMTISDILRNPVYVMSEAKVYEYLRNKGMHTCGEPNGNGILIYNKKNSKSKHRNVSEWVAAVSRHKGIIPADKWLHIQNTLDKNSKKDNIRQGTSKKSLLSGILKCATCGSPMRITYGRHKKDGSERIYYYTCTMKAHSGKTRCDNPNVRGDHLEQHVIDQLLETNVEVIIKELENARQEAAITEGNSIIKNMHKDVDLKKKELNSLITQLSRLESPVAQDLILLKIEALGKEIKDIEISLQDTELETKQKEALDLNYKILIEAIKEFNDFFTSIEALKDDEETVGKKRYLIERAVDKITVDGKTKDVVISLWGAKKK
jgi:site-specific DNA recombinase